MRYAINVQVFVRLVKSILSVKSWLYAIYITPSCYYFVIESLNQSKAIFKVTEIQSEFDNIYIQLDPEIIEQFRSMKLTGLTGDITFEKLIDPQQVKMKFPDEVFLGSYQYFPLSPPKLVLEEDTALVGSNSGLFDFMAVIPDKLDYIGTHAQTLVGVDLTANYVYFTPFNVASKFSILEPKFFSSTISKQNLASTFLYSSSLYKSSMTVKLSRKDLAEIQVFYREILSKSIDENISLMYQLKEEIISKGRKLNPSIDKVQKILNKAKEKDLGETELINLTRDYKIYLKDYIRIFKDVTESLPSLYLMKNKLITVFPTHSMLTTCYHLPTTYSPSNE